MSKITVVKHDVVCQSPDPLQPIIVSIEQATLPCGCTIVPGKRLDNQEVAMASCPCTPAHNELMTLFNAAFALTLDNPTDRPLMDVVVEVLDQTIKRHPTLAH
jgi:hypothetical protein